MANIRQDSRTISVRRLTRHAFVVSIGCKRNRRWFREGFPRGEYTQLCQLFSDNQKEGKERDRTLVTLPR